MKFCNQLIKLIKKRTHSGMIIYFKFVLYIYITYTTVKYKIYIHVHYIIIMIQLYNKIIYIV